MKLFVLFISVRPPFSPHTFRMATHSCTSPEPVAVACRAYNVDVFRRHAGTTQRQLNALGLTAGVRQDEIRRVAVHRVAGDLAVDFRSPGTGGVEPFEDEQATAFGHHNAVAGQRQTAATPLSGLRAWPAPLGC